MFITAILLATKYILGHAENECHAWFDADSEDSEDAHPHSQIQNTQTLYLQCIYLVDGLWTSDSQYNGYG